MARNQFGGDLWGQFKDKAIPNRSKWVPFIPVIGPQITYGDHVTGTNISGTNPNKGPQGSQIPDSYWKPHDRRTQTFDGKNWVAKPPAPAPRTPQVPINAQQNRAYAGPTESELRRYSDAQVQSQYRPTINDITRQMDAANAMGEQAQGAIGGWGREAGREIRGAGRRNYREVRGIQSGLGSMLGAVAAAAGPMRTDAANAALMRDAAGTAGTIAGLGAADQGWFNRARDVNAQTTNFYRSNARDQYAQQAADLLAKRNEQVAAMRSDRAAGRINAKQQAYENQQAADNGSDGTLGIAMQNFQQSLGKGSGVKQLMDTFKNQVTSPAERAVFEKWVRDNYFGTADTVQGQTRLRQVRANREQAKTAQ